MHAFVRKENHDMKRRLEANEEKNSQRENVKWQLECGDVLNQVFDVMCIDFDAESAERMVNNYRACCNGKIHRKDDVGRRTTVRDVN